MYESFFGMREKPFRLNPDPAFFFDSEGHRRALAHLEYGVHRGEGFIVVTGEVGAGKTTLLRALLRKIPRDTVVPAQIVSTQVDADDLLRLIASAFGIPGVGADKASVLQALQRYLLVLHSQGKHALLLIDEAQNLSARAIEELRMLSNFQIGNVSLIQSFLVGQPEFRDTLDSQAMNKFRQRVVASYHLGALAPQEVRAYVEHRLTVAGWTGRPTIHASAFDVAYRHTGGIPRQLNSLLDRTLLSCYLNEKRDITGADVDEVGQEMYAELGPSSGSIAGNGGVATNLTAASYAANGASNGPSNGAANGTHRPQQSGLGGERASEGRNGHGRHAAAQDNHTEESLAKISEQLASIQKSVRQFFLE